MDQLAPGVAQSPSHLATATATIHHNGPGSTESTPKSSQNNGADWDEPLPQVPGAKLRLMCSYGGHIIPRPHDKSLCYVGGETRIVGVDRNSSFIDLCTRLSRSLLDGRRFTLKYQLPNEDLDSLISVATDEDLENMVEEYDRLMATTTGGGGGGAKVSKNSRIRLFLFFTKPETAQTMGVLLDDAKSETWFVEALNGADVLPRGVSDSAAIDDLLSLGSNVTDHELGSQQLPLASSHVALPTPTVALPLLVTSQQDVESVQSIMFDSPMIETTSSFDSSTSSPSIAHLPPIRVRVDDVNGAPILGEETKIGGLEDQFSTQLRVIPPLPTTILSTQCTTTPTNFNVGGQSDHNSNRVVVSDDERSDVTAPVVSRKPPLPLPIPPMQQRVSAGFNLPSPDSKHAGGFGLPSPDSVASDSSSIASATSFSKVAVNQDSGAQYSTLVDHTKLTTMNTNNDSSTENPAPTPQTYMYPPLPHDQQPQPQFVQTNMHYIPTQAPIPSYYPFYATQPPTHPNHQIDPPQQYPMYLLPITQTQPYNLAIQPSEPTVVSSMVQPSSVTHVHPSMYPTRAVATTPQFQPQYAAYTSVARPVEGGAGVNYGNYDYGNDNHFQPHHQLYYTGQVAPGAAATTTPIVAGSQYQSMTPAQAVMIAEASMQLPPTDNSPQPARTS